MGITIKTEGRIDLDLSTALDAAVVMAVGMIRRHSGLGVALDGGPMAWYSESYAKTLAAMGEAPEVDLTVTGAYLAGISERERLVTADRATATIGPGTGTSEKRRPMTSAEVNAPKGKRRKEGVVFDRRRGVARMTGQRSPPHNVLGSYLHFGTVNMKARPHIGLLPEEAAAIREMIASLVIKQG